MREILFRGKRTDNGEWVEGQLLYFKSSVGIEEFALIVESCEWDNSKEWFNLGKRARVIPETVGQYTGLTDKNGKKIFEGDICRHRSNYSGNTVISVVTYKDGHFLALVDENSGFELSEKLEIIGNIHDKLKLLKGE